MIDYFIVDKNPHYLLFKEPRTSAFRSSLRFVLTLLLLREISPDWKDRSVSLYSSSMPSRGCAIVPNPPVWRPPEPDALPEMADTKVWEFGLLPIALTYVLLLRLSSELSGLLPATRSTKEVLNWVVILGARYSACWTHFESLDQSYPLLAAFVSPSTLF